MSNQTNELIMERAYELIEEIVSDPAGRDDMLMQLIKEGDMDNLLAHVQKVEAEVSQEHFQNNNIIEYEDVY